MLTVFVDLKLRTTVYKAEVKMLISGEKQVESRYYRELGGLRNPIATQSEIVKSNPVIERAVKATKLYQRPLDYEKNFCYPLKARLIDLRVKRIVSMIERMKPEQRESFLFRMAVDDLRKNVTVEPIRDSDLFRISVCDFSPLGVAILANVVSRSYIIFDLDQQLVELRLKYGEKHLAVTQLKDNIEKMTNSLNGKPLPDTEAIGPASVKIVEQALVPFSPTGIPKTLIFLLAFPMSLFLALMFAFGLEYIDQTFRSPRDIEKILNVPYLGYIPKKAIPSSYLSLSEHVYSMMKDKGLKSLLIAAFRAEDALAIIANLGRHIAGKGGTRVLMIDANLIKPSMHAILGIPNNTGVIDVLSGNVSFEKAIISMNPNLNILTAGNATPDMITHLEPHSMSDLLKAASDGYDITLVNSADLKRSEDAVALSASVDAAVLIVNEGGDRRQAVKFSISLFQRKKANLLGVILSNRVFPIPEGIYKRI